MANAKSTKNPGRNFSIIMALIMGVLATILVIQNSAEVSIKLWFWQLKSSLIVLLAITLVLGMLFTYLLMIGKVRRLKKENSKLRKELGKRPPEGRGEQAGTQ
jgi:uncharacterized integral membrane protein